MKYTMKDIVILDDAVAAIRRNPVFYGGEPPRGARLAAALAGNLIEYGDRPVSIDFLEGWWIVTCGKDWLAGAGRSAYWSRIIPTHEVARESMRSEVLLTAFSKGLLTIVERKVQWLVKGPEIPNALENLIKQKSDASFQGRIAAFTVD
jgi:hypothetical protein